MPYKHINIEPRVYPIGQLIDDTAPDTLTALAREIHAESTLAYAAPDLLDALSLLVSIFDGKGAGTNVDGKWMGIPDWEHVAIARAAIARAAIARATSI